MPGFTFIFSSHSSTHSLRSGSTRAWTVATRLVRHYGCTGFYIFSKRVRPQGSKPFYFWALPPRSPKNPSEKKGQYPKASRRNMKLSEITKNTLRARDLIDLANAQLNKAESTLDLVQWISPSGDLYIEPKSAIIDMIHNGSWK